MAAAPPEKHASDQAEAAAGGFPRGDDGTGPASGGVVICNWCAGNVAEAILLAFSSQLKPGKASAHPSFHEALQKAQGFLDRCPRTQWGDSGCRRHAGGHQSRRQSPISQFSMPRCLGRGAPRQTRLHALDFPQAALAFAKVGYAAGRPPAGFHSRLCSEEQHVLNCMAGDEILGSMMGIAGGADAAAALRGGFRQAAAVRDQVNQAVMGGTLFGPLPLYCGPLVFVDHVILSPGETVVAPPTRQVVDASAAAKGITDCVDVGDWDGADVRLAGAYKTFCPDPDGTMSLCGDRSAWLHCPIWRCAAAAGTCYAAPGTWQGSWQPPLAAQPAEVTKMNCAFGAMMRAAARVANQRAAATVVSGIEGVEIRFEATTLAARACIFQPHLTSSWACLLVTVGRLVNSPAFDDKAHHFGDGKDEQIGDDSVLAEARALQTSRALVADANIEALKEVHALLREAAARCRAMERDEVRFRIAMDAEL